MPGVGPLLGPLNIRNEVILTTTGNKDKAPKITPILLLFKIIKTSCSYSHNIPIPLYFAKLTIYLLNNGFYFIKYT